ncbi:sugar phosphate nucleotidyltransferase [Paenibacillus sp. NPDC058071]|uniref:sugar phosphate nucleotidyltransferase n=1 Tax=Paenibacillus sp. NPDC058071 TaxID=3346326 RepID=UPI0036D9ADC9
MKLVLLSGGSGTRLWPLSNDARSKQFLKVLEDEEGRLVSMAQRVWGQLRENGLAESTCIATARTQVEMMQNQLGDRVPLIVEPERRDTFAAIALASVYLYSRKGVALDETIVILPVDPYVESRFFDTVKRLDDALCHTDAELALIGVRPTYASSKYGYMVPAPGSDQEEYGSVLQFIEKPAEERAVSLIARGALWNSGVFAFKLGFMIDHLLRRGYPIQYDALASQYDTLPKISFDYEVAEHMSRIAFIPYDGCWKDIGTWNTLTEEMGDNRLGKGQISEDCVNTHLVNETDLPVSIIGVSNVIVAVSPDGILVSDKKASPRIKDYIGHDRMPMYEERQWGWQRVLEIREEEDGSRVVTKRLLVGKGRSVVSKLDAERREIWTCVKGSGELLLNGERHEVKTGFVTVVPRNAALILKAAAELEMIVIEMVEGSIGYSAVPAEQARLEAAE